MTYKYEYLSMQNMNLRPEPNVNNSPIGFVKAGIKAFGDELFLLDNGDKWLKVLSGGSTTGWVAGIHLGRIYGAITEILPILPTETFPEYFILEAPTGERKRYDRSAL